MSGARLTAERVNKLIKAMQKVGMIGEHNEITYEKYERWAQYMLKGGAKAGEVLEMMNRLKSADTLLLGRYNWLTENDKRIHARISSERALARLNTFGNIMRTPSDSISERRIVTAQECSRVKAMNTALIQRYPVTAARYREIAQRVDMKVDRVRYIIEGPRRGRRGK